MTYNQLKFRVELPEGEGFHQIDQNPHKDNSTRSGISKKRSGGKHQMAACSACKKKRKKCDGKYPVCSGCDNSGTECTIYDITTSRIIPRNYIETLEGKLAELADKLQHSKATIEKLEGLLQHNEISEGSPQSCELPMPPTLIHKNQDYNQHNQKYKNLESEIGYITLGVGAESRFMGDTSAFSIAKAITNSIDYYKKESRTASLFTFNGISTPPEPEEFEPPFTKPSFKAAQLFLSSYKVIVQCQYPFLEWKWVEKCFQRVMENDSEDPEEMFFIYMIFAIGAQLSSNNSRFSTLAYVKVYYNKAMEFIGPIIEVNTIRTVQAYLMISAFSQKMPDGSSIWQSTGLAIRTAVALGLHRQPYRNKEDQKLAEEARANLQLRYRIFWCAYGMERINGIVLGRPFGISDVDIDALMPTESPEIAVACHVFKLRRIQSSICTFVYKPVAIMDSFEEIDTTRVQIVLELNEWMTTFPAKAQPISIFETNNWSQISYHNSMVLLLRPVVLEVSKLREHSNPRLLEWFKVFTQSASAICMNYKDLHSKGKLGYTWLAMHCVFVAGLSFLYCLWIDTTVKVLEWKRRRLIYDTVSACSSSLYVLAERFPTASVFRDTYERIANTVLTKVEDAKKDTPVKFTAQGDFTMGVLDEGSIGIDQYLGYEADLKAQLQSDASMTNTQRVTNSKSPMSSDFVYGIGDGKYNYNGDGSMWEFLDNTGDKFLRDIYYDMENNFAEDRHEREAG
ncbi:hypothetical protein QFC19_006000 [Naganishia cerealis]|uniref:Uncharacterized protein n=1 Tax=Naganishia cerealis TaxID=610337 RepID=A0ACC2VKG6_9TREE|nr:hypothetical protein QFC19_006000 [Naganishia cerealis]